MIPLPAYIDPEAWAGFVEMRKAMPKSRPFTHRAAVLILKELQRIKDAGHDPNAALDQSTLHGWMDVYPPKDKEIVKTREAEFLESQRQRDEQAARQLGPIPAAVRERVAKLRRVA